MQTSEESKLEQQVPGAGSASGAPEGEASAANKEPVVAAAAKKKASKKKASKKKASKKKASKKKASKKKASKKKASKKKTRKKKSRKKKVSASGDPMARVLVAAEELRDALQDLASHELSSRRKAVEELQATARSKISDLETAAQKGLARLTRRS